jgi:hypothetical protein
VLTSGMSVQLELALGPSQPPRFCIFGRVRWNFIDPIFSTNARYATEATRSRRSVASELPFGDPGKQPQPPVASELARRGQPRQSATLT